MDGRMHRGALAFTLIVGAASAWMFGGWLLRPLPQAPIEVASPSPPEEEIDPAALRTPLVAELHSEWYTQSAGPVIDVGEVADITIQFRNVGHTAWIKGSPSELRLGEVGPRPLPDSMRVDWLAWDRVAAQTEEIVLEYQLATFSFRVRGAAPGTFRLNVRPVVDGVAWLRDEGVHVDVTVRG